MMRAMSLMTKTRSRVPRSWQVRDFRARRRLLDSEDFALGRDRPNPPASDRIAKEVWRNLMALPDDVAVTTTNHHGSAIATLNKMRWAFLDLLADPLDQFSKVLLDVQDEFGAGLVFAIQGYYRQAAAALRTAAELSIIGAACSASSKWSDFDDWRNGALEAGFGKSADQLRGIPSVAALEAHLSALIGDTLFAPRSGPNPGGWSRRLYKVLSNYAHSRPRFANADIWESNGPIYVRSAFVNFAKLFTEVYAFSLLLVRIGRGGAALVADVPAPYHARSRSRLAKLVRTANAFL